MNKNVLITEQQNPELGGMWPNCFGQINMCAPFNVVLVVLVLVLVVVLVLVLVVLVVVVVEVIIVIIIIMLCL